MAKRKKRIDPEEPLQELTICMRRLSEDQGAVARANARRAVFAELRRLRGWVGRTYPSKRRRKKAANKSKKIKKPQKLTDDYGIMPGNISPMFAAAGITVKLLNTGGGTNKPWCRSGHSNSFARTARCTHSSARRRTSTTGRKSSWRSDGRNEKHERRDQHHVSKQALHRSR